MTQNDPMNPDTYTCAMCGETYEYERSDEEAQTEAEALWGDALGDDPAIVCDDCFQAMTRTKPPAQTISAARLDGNVKL